MRNRLAVGAVVALAAAGVLLPASASQAAPPASTDPAAAAAKDGSSLGDLAYLVPNLARGLLEKADADSDRPHQEPAADPEAGS
ncbi:hypothetical protein ACH4VX_23290 [Streptomyces sp. NPDC020731]|uniref:hypothetical protein n=1 Tax=Streptomyces sp. NPDC020731 TaxID=3365085 RepID=UPI0037B53F27